MEINDSYWMKKALKFAEKSIGRTSPNPAVGAVIVKDNQLIGIGRHEFCGGPHAEINAFRSLKDPALAKGATIYVTLEPCSSYGRTPPCCNAIIEHGIARVVAGCTDPNPKHAGRGLELLRSNGIETVVGVEEEACRKRHEAFFKWIRTKRPFVLLKLAETLDGKIAAANGSSRWITGEAARHHVMDLRMWADAVIAGAETFRCDHPSFTCRDGKGRVLKTPRRIIISRHPEQIQLPDDSWSAVNLEEYGGWDGFLAKLGEDQVTSILLEGGGELAGSALRAGVIDKVEFHIAPKLLGGRNSRSLGGDDVDTIDAGCRLTNMTIRRCGCDWIAEAWPDYGKEG